MVNVQQNSKLPLKEVVKQELFQAPVSLDNIAAKLGLRVNRQALDDNISGMISCDNNTNLCEITINSNHHSNRQRFTLAHEIAHFVLHRDIIGNSLTDDAMFRSTNEYGLKQYYERQANYYAAEILMPAELVKLYWDTGLREIKEYSKEFLVSKAVAIIRLESLGYKL